VLHVKWCGALMAIGGIIGDPVERSTKNQMLAKS
jgi:hypothetical protein